MGHTAIAPAPASLSCPHCYSRKFHAQLSEGGTYLLLACSRCTRPLLFAVERLHDFPTGIGPLVIDAEIIQEKSL